MHVPSETKKEWQTHHLHAHHCNWRRSGVAGHDLVDHEQKRLYIMYSHGQMVSGSPPQRQTAQLMCKANVRGYQKYTVLSSSYCPLPKASRQLFGVFGFSRKPCEMSRARLHDSRVFRLSFTFSQTHAKKPGCSSSYAHDMTTWHGF